MGYIIVPIEMKDANVSYETAGDLFRQKKRKEARNFPSFDPFPSIYSTEFATKFFLYIAGIGTEGIKLYEGSSSMMSEFISRCLINIMKLPLNNEIIECINFTKYISILKNWIIFSCNSDVCYQQFVKQIILKKLNEIETTKYILLPGFLKLSNSSHEVVYQIIKNNDCYYFNIFDACGYYSSVYNYEIRAKFYNKGLIKFGFNQEIYYPHYDPCFVGYCTQFDLIGDIVEIFTLHPLSPEIAGFQNLHISLLRHSELRNLKEELCEKYITRSQFLPNCCYKSFMCSFKKMFDKEFYCNFKMVFKLCVVLLYKRIAFKLNQPFDYGLVYKRLKRKLQNPIYFNGPYYNLLVQLCNVYENNQIEIFENLFFK